MNVGEIIKLLDAGFTKEDILNLYQEQQEPQQDPEEPQQQEPQQEPQQQEPQQPDNSDITSAVNEFKAAINDFKKEVIAANVLNSRQDPDKKLTAETAVANIINPFLNKKEGN